MANKVLGLHCTTGSRNGYGITAPKAAVIVGTTGGAFDDAGPNAYKVYRPVDAGYVDIFPEFEDAQLNEMEHYANLYWPQLLAKIESVQQAHGQVDAVQLTNEVGGNDELQIRKLIAYETRLMDLCEQAGLTLCVANNAPNSPDWYVGHWQDLFVPFIKYAWQRGHIYSRHVYFDVWPYTYNWQRLSEELDHLRTVGPTGPVLITELGYVTFPGTADLVYGISEYENVMLQYPEIGGGAIWTYGDWDGPGGGNGNIQDASEALSNLFGDPPAKKWVPTYPIGGAPIPPPIPGDCFPREQYARVYNVIPDDATLEQAVEIFTRGWLASKQTSGGSYDDAGYGPNLPSRRALLWDLPRAKQRIFIDWYDKHYPGTIVEFPQLNIDPPPALEIIDITDELIKHPTKTYTNRPIGGINAVVIHHSATTGTTRATIDAIARHHVQQQDWPGIGYHFVITGNGTVYQVNRLDTHAYQTGTVAGNRETIGICLLGNFQTGAPTTSQLTSCRALVSHLRQQLAPQTIAAKRHHQYVTTACPGNNWATWWLAATGEQPPAPPNTNIRFGIHASADSGDLSEVEFAEFRAAKPGLIKVLSSHSGTAISRLAIENPAAEVMVRIFLHFGGRVISPAKFYEDTIADVTRAVNSLPGKIVYLEVHNEPNLADEGLWTSWHNGSEFSDWFVAVVSMFRANLPGNVRFMYPGLSPGGYIPNIRQHHIGFLQTSGRGLDACDALGAHVYWGQNYPMDTALTDLRTISTFAGTKPVYVTEVSNNQQGPSPTTKANEYVHFWRQVNSIPANIAGIAYFVMSASNPAWGWTPNQPGSGETWIHNGESLGMGTIVGTRKKE